MKDFTAFEFSLCVAGATILAAFAGLINAISLLSHFAQSVSHMTGTTTALAISIISTTITEENGDGYTDYPGPEGGGSRFPEYFPSKSTTADPDPEALRLIRRPALVLITFILGAFISGSITGSITYKPHRGYGLLLTLESAALFLATHLKLHNQEAGLYLLSLACGIQNALCTAYSGAVVRTTHVTGLVTDVGMIAGMAVFHPQTREENLWKLAVLVPIWMGFFGGGGIGVAAWEVWRERALYLPAVGVGVVGIAHV
ncbi:hypothetical protein HK102_007366, partial [Quaeritorhiza haematococci]